MFEIFILSVLQGITEFIPVSSSSHLILASDFFDIKFKSLAIDVSLHIGSFLAVVLYFYKDIILFFKNKKILIFGIIASTPLIFIGFILVYFKLIYLLRSVEIIAITTILFGVLLFWSDKQDTTKDIKNDFDFKTAVIIGLFQTLALIPGVSRSGIVITISRFLNFNRIEATKISFLISIPTLAAVSFYGLNTIHSSNDILFSKVNFLSIVGSFIISYLTIKYFLIFLKRFSLTLFVVYRILLGLILIKYVYF